MPVVIFEKLKSAVLACAALAAAALLAPAGASAAVTCDPSVQLVDHGLADLQLGGGTLKVASLDVVYDTGCGGAEGSGLNYSVYGPPTVSAEWSGIRTGEANLAGTDHYDLDPGRAYHVELHASCCTNCNGLGVESKSADVTSNTVVAPAWLGPSFFISRQAPYVYDCFATGKEVLFRPTFTGQAEGDERWRVRLQGAGLDYDQTFTQEQIDDLANNPIPITAPGSGPVDFWVVHEPYGVASGNHLTLQADPSGCLEGEDAGTGAPEADAGSGDDPSDEPGSGCSAAGAPLSVAALAGAALLLAPALRSRRRR